MDQFQRTELLFGREAIEIFQQSRVAVIGLGGVGSYAAEGLVRSGVGKVLLVDFDTVGFSNLNRQLPALHSTVGQLKTEAMRDRLLDINPEVEVEIFNGFCNQDSRADMLQNLDFVVDAIDSLTPKAGLMEHCFKNNIPIITALGAASRFDPSKIVLTDISKTHTCPLAKKIRKYMHRRGIHKGIPVIFSTEKPIPQYAPEEGTMQEWNEGHGRVRGTLGSVVYMPAIIGMWACSYVLRELSGK